MTVTLNLKPEVEAGLLAQARASGVPVEEFLISLVVSAARGTLRDPALQADPARAEAVRRMLEFGEKHQLSLGEPITRKLLHEGHRV
jgi:hypothetical protein